MNTHECTWKIGIALAVALTAGDICPADGPLFPGALYPPKGANAIGDLNGDGVPDVAVSSGNPQTVSILLGDGTGRLVLSGEYGPYQRVYSTIQARDLDNDGDLDLATVGRVGSYPFAGELSVLLGNGDGTFEYGVTIELGTYESGVLFVGDLDGDTDEDLIAVYDGAGLSVLLNNGDATFAAPASVTLPSYKCATLAELNGDSHLDLAVATGATVQLLRGVGDGTFGTPSYAGQLSGYDPQITASDVDADGDQDLLAWYSYSSVMHVLRNYGHGTFAPAETYQIAAYAPYCGGLAAGDLNGDGHLDVVVGSAGTEDFWYGIFHVLLGRADGTLGPAQEYYDFVPGAAFPKLVDLNGDGNLDVVSNGVAVLLGNGDGTLLSASCFEAEAHYNLVSGDLDGDGDVDLATTAVDVLLNDGTGAYSAPVRYSGRGHHITAADLDGDGDLDLATVDSSAGTTSVLLNNGDATFAEVQVIQSGSGSRDIAAGDLNGDSIPDLAVANRDSDNVAVFIAGGDGTLVPPWLVYPVGSTPWGVAIGDLDGDGNGDLVVANHESGSDSDIYVLMGNGDGTFAYPPTTYPVGFAPVALGDLDHDGDLDLVAGNAATDGLVVFLGNGDGTFGAGTEYVTIGLPLYDLAIGDVNGDGHPDLAAVEYQEWIYRWWRSVHVLPGRGDGTFDPVMYFGAPAWGVTIDDLNGDGALDLASMDHGVVVLLNQSPAIPGDVDGDGDVDLSDLAALLSSYRHCVGEPEYIPEADFDDSGCVDLSDLAELLGHYGEGI